MRPRLFDIVIVLLLATALAFVTAPLFAFRALKSAATYEDVAAIGELVDFPATRRSLTQQLEARIAPAPATAEPPSLWRNPLGALRRAVEPIVPPKPEVDRYLSVAGFSALTRGYAPGAAPPLDTAPKGLWSGLADAVRGPHPTMVYWDPHRVRIAVPRPGAKDKRTVFTWSRGKWFEWKLVAVTLPQGEP